MNIYLANQIDTSLYKIGVTKKNPLQRLNELQTGNANKIILIASFPTKWDFKMESALHNTYKTKKINQEWFELTDDDVSLFIDTCDKMEKNFDVLKQFNNPFI